MLETPDPPTISVGSCQMVPILGDVDASLAEVKRALSWAQEESLDVVCLPECHLTGYCRTPEEAAAHSIDLGSTLFSRLMSELRQFDPAVILGLMERCGQELFNSAVIVERGRVLGVYRKQHLVESAFSPGRESPVFERNGVRYGVNICYDANFPEAAATLAARRPAESPSQRTRSRVRRRRRCGRISASLWVAACGLGKRGADVGFRLHELRVRV